jgi:hypothetical protein
MTDSAWVQSVRVPAVTGNPRCVTSARPLRAGLPGVIGLLPGRPGGWTRLALVPTGIVSAGV